MFSPHHYGVEMLVKFMDIHIYKGKQILYMLVCYRTSSRLIKSHKRWGVMSPFVPQMSYDRPRTIFFVIICFSKHPPHNINIIWMVNNVWHKQCSLVRSLGLPITIFLQGKLVFEKEALSSVAQLVERSLTTYLIWNNNVVSSQNIC